jgi:hypothetical protein
VDGNSGALHTMSRAEKRRASSLLAHVLSSMCWHLAMIFYCLQSLEMATSLKPWIEGLQTRTCWFIIKPVAVPVTRWYHKPLSIPTDT